MVKKRGQLWGGSSICMCGGKWGWTFLWTLGDVAEIWRFANVTAIAIAIAILLLLCCVTRLYSSNYYTASVLGDLRL